jgi:cytochrome oxidase Cu insertion factor (SCO1/SenC/PrrC family)
MAGGFSDKAARCNILNSGGLMRRISSLFIFLFLFVISACAGMDVKTTPSVSGQIAPDFTLTDQDGKAWNLSDAVKDYHAVVLAFYPKDDTKL